MAVLAPRIKSTAILIGLIMLVGTAYSYWNHSYLDTSNPLLAHLPHPAHGQSFFANKKNILNQWFVKRSWGWTSLAFWALWLTAPEGSTVRDGLSIGRWISATTVWVFFVSWLFGPSLFDRIGQFSGNECVVVLPSTTDTAISAVYTIPAQYCHTRTLVSPSTHPALFTITDAANVAATPQWGSDVAGLIPRFSRGHDVSGHTFLLTLSVLFLVDHLVRSTKTRARPGATSGPKPPPPNSIAAAAVAAGWLLVGLWIVMLGATAVYFHTWQEKLSGFVLALVGYVVSQYPFDDTPAPPSAQPSTVPVPQKAE